MVWIALVLFVVLAAGVLGTLLDIALSALALIVLVLVAGGLVAATSARSRARSGARR
jgi:hypothetical protein